MNSGREASETPELSETDKDTTQKRVGLLTRTIPNSFVTRTTQERREERMGRITRQHYGMEE